MRYARHESGRDKYNLFAKAKDSRAGVWFFAKLRIVGARESERESTRMVENKKFM